MTPTPKSAIRTTLVLAALVTIPLAGAFHGPIPPAPRTPGPCGGWNHEWSSYPFIYTFDSTPSIVFDVTDDPQTCGIESFGMRLDDAPVQGDAFEQNGHYIFVHSVQTPLATGEHVAELHYVENCCNWLGGRNNDILTHTFYVIDI